MKMRTRKLPLTFEYEDEELYNVEQEFVDEQGDMELPLAAGVEAYEEEDTELDIFTVELV